MLFYLKFKSVCTFRYSYIYNITIIFRNVIELRWCCLINRGIMINFILFKCFNYLLQLHIFL